MAYDPSIFNTSPYYDDFDPEKAFLRVLFKPGYAVQARELTTAQSILQDQVSKIGDHLFKDGSRIVGGAIGVRNTAFVMVKVGTGTAFEGIVDYSFVVGAKIDNALSNSTVYGTISHYIKPDTATDGYLILIVDFEAGSSFISNSTVYITTVDNPTTPYSLTTGSELWTYGSCKLVYISPGIFYINGFFVQNTEQYYSPYRIVDGHRDLSFTENTKFDLLSTKIGFTISGDSVTENEDPTLRDPAIGSYNYNAPGADRYSVSLTLAQTETVDDTPDNFIELLRFESGKITKKSERITYGEIEKTLAARTYDESGSYIAKPFEISISPSTVPSDLNVTLSPGKAYVYGHEIETVYPQTLIVPKARTTPNEVYIGTYSQTVGNYIGISLDFANYGTTLSSKLPIISNGSASVQFRNNTGVIVGEARVHGLIGTGFVDTTGVTSNKYNLYLYGISAGSIIAGASSGVIKEHSTGFTLTVFTPLTGTTFQAPQKSSDISLVYEIKPGYAIKDFTSLSFTGKAVSGVLPAANISWNATNNNTTYTVTSSLFADTIAAPGTPSAGEFAFKNYLSNTTSADIIKHIQLVKNGVVYSPSNRVGTGVTLSSIDKYSFSLTVPNNNVAPGYTSGDVRVICPYVYTINTFTNSNIRTKTSTVVTGETFTTLQTDYDGRKYVRLANWDVYSIDAVTRVSDGVNIASDWEFDDGQKDTHYDYSRLYLKPSKASLYTVFPTNGIKVNYKYYSHGGYSFAPFIGSNSYPEYGSIPLYTSKRTGKTVSLANCIDFRHSGPLNPSAIAKPYGDSQFSGEYTYASYNNYLPRIDKIKLSVDPTDNSAIFTIENGEPDLAPIAPPDSENALTLYTMTVPAYTHNTRDVLVTPFDNKRYTMADIGKIEKRVDEVETFAKLSYSESQIEAKALAPILNTTTEPIKTSIYSDTFFGHGGGDVVSSEHICSVDYENGELRPFFTHLPLSLGTPTPSGTTVSPDGIWTLNYSGITYLANAGYTKKIKPNPTSTKNWLGFAFITKPIETQWDRGYRPIVKTNTLSENDNWLASNANAQEGFGTQWNDWESMWSGIEDKEEESDIYQKKLLQAPRTSSSSLVPSVNSGNPQIGVDRNQVPDDEQLQSFVASKQLRNHIKTRVGTRVIDKTVIPFIPTATLTVSAYGLKPATTVYLYFDGVAIGNTATTDSNGSVSITFTIQPNTFLAGEKLVRISDNIDSQNASTAAETVYYCGGSFLQRDSGSYSTRPPHFRRQTVTSEGVIKDPFNRDVSYDSLVDTVENLQWIDPLAQTFLVDKKTNPNGIFVKSVSLYFSAKSATLPVAVQLRPTVNGYPSPSVVIPFSTVVKTPSGVTVGRNASSLPLPTNFSFSSPIYLEPGEYAITVITNSSDYQLYAADNGLAVSTGGRAGGSSLLGNLYVPQTIGSAVQDNVTDICFAIERCNFAVNSSGTFSYPVNGWGGAQVAKIYTPEIAPTTCSISRILDGKTIQNNQNLWPNTPITTGNSTTIQYTMRRGLDSAVSPVVDMDAVFGIAAKMVIQSAPTTDSPTSSYVTKAVVLPEENISNGLVVISEACIPTGSSVIASYRYSTNGEADLFDQPWITMTAKNTFISSTELDFRSARWIGTASNIRAYQIKMQLLAPSTSAYRNTPAIRNLQVVSYR